MSKIINSFPYVVAQLIFHSVAFDIETLIGFPCHVSYFHMSWLINFARSTTYRRCYEKTSYVSNYAFFTSLYKWVDRGQMHRLEKLLCV